MIVPGLVLDGAKAYIEYQWYESLMASRAEAGLSHRTSDDFTKGLLISALDGVRTATRGASNVEHGVWVRHRGSLCVTPTMLGHPETTDICALLVAPKETNPGLKTCRLP